MSEVNDLIQQIKDKANALEYNEDGIAFDRAVGEIDLLCYELRQTAWPRKPRGIAVLPLSEPSDVIGVHNFFKELFGE